MLLTITTTHRPATDLGFLLHKNPARPQSDDLGFGVAHVFYPEATEERCTAALLVEVDTVALARGRGNASEGKPLEPYVNDRPYAASSFLSVALTRLFRSALSATSKERPELVDEAIPLEATLACVPCRGGEELLRRLFDPSAMRWRRREAFAYYRTSGCRRSCARRSTWARAPSFIVCCFSQPLMPWSRVPSNHLRTRVRRGRTSTGSALADSGEALARAAGARPRRRGAPALRAQRAAASRARVRLRRPRARERTGGPAPLRAMQARRSRIKAD
jgi:RNA repair, ligase-Pnkp-associating, region of Hen1